MDLGVIAMKGHSAFSKTLALLEPQHPIIYSHIQESSSYPSAEKDLVLSAASAELAILPFNINIWFLYRCLQKSLIIK